MLSRPAAARWVWLAGHASAQLPLSPRPLPTRRDPSPTPAGNREGFSLSPSFQKGNPDGAEAEPRPSRPAPPIAGGHRAALAPGCTHSHPAHDPGSLHQPKTARPPGVPAPTPPHLGARLSSGGQPGFSQLGRPPSFAVSGPGARLLSAHRLGRGAGPRSWAATPRAPGRGGAGRRVPSARCEPPRRAQAGAATRGARRRLGPSAAPIYTPLYPTRI